MMQNLGEAQEVRKYQSAKLLLQLAKRQAQLYNYLKMSMYIRYPRNKDNNVYGSWFLYSASLLHFQLFICLSTTPS